MKTLKLSLLFGMPMLFSPAAFAMTPTQAAIYQQQQHQQQQNMAGQIMHNRQTCGKDYCGYEGDRRMQEYNERSNQRTKSFFVGLSNRFGIIGLKYDDGEVTDIFSTGGPRMPAGSKELAAIEFERQCNDPDRCIALILYTNTCPAIAAGDLKDGSGKRYYTSSRASISSPHVTAGQTYDLNFNKEMTKAPRDEALRRCQSDPAVRSASCIAPEADEQIDFCALPQDIRENRWVPW